MEDEELFRELGSNSRFNQARLILTGTIGLIQQEMIKNRSMVRIRKLEFEAVEKILKLYNIDPREISES